MPKNVYNHLACQQMKGLRITLSKEGLEDKRQFAMLGLSSKETIRTGLKAVDASPFKTIFVVEETSGEVLFALSKNDSFVKASRKKAPPPPPPPPTMDECCQLCYEMGGYSCQSLADGSCICFGATRGPGGNLDDELGTL